RPPRHRAAEAPTQGQGIAARREGTAAGPLRRPPHFALDEVAERARSEGPREAGIARGESRQRPTLSPSLNQRVPRRPRPEQRVAQSTRARRPPWRPFAYALRPYFWIVWSMQLSRCDWSLCVTQPLSACR